MSLKGQAGGAKCVRPWVNPAIRKKFPETTAANRASDIGTPVIYSQCLQPDATYPLEIPAGNVAYDQGNQLFHPPKVRDTVSKFNPSAPACSVQIVHRHRCQQ